MPRLLTAIVVLLLSVHASVVVGQPLPDAASESAASPVGSAPRAAQSAPSADVRDSSGLTSPGSAQDSPARAAAPSSGEQEPIPKDASDSEVAALRQEVTELRENLELLQLANETRELAALEETTSVQALKIYGFTGVGLVKLFPPKDPFLAAVTSRKLSFLLGSLNLYFDAQPTESWRALTEVRLTNYPHGQDEIDPLTGRFTRIDTRVFDTNSSSARNRVVWGGIILERAQIERYINPLFNLRAGYFLTPYGIWNVDHGIPTLISNILPQFQVEEAIPQRQLGVEAFGETYEGSWEFGYRAYVSNGRAPYLKDLSDNKAFGGRLTTSYDGSARVTMGVSGFIGDTQDYSRQLQFSDGQLGVSTELLYQYDEWAAGADLAVDWGDLRLRTEALVRHVHHKEGYHEPIALGAPGTYYPNRYEYYWYSILAYRWKMIEPYTYTELKRTSPGVAGSRNIYLPSVGFNLHFSPFTQLKTQYMAPKFYEEPGPSRNFRVIDSRLVMSF